MNDLICRAFEFAAIRHASQRRKGVEREPYINHPIEVARLINDATNGQDESLVVAGVLHDTIEDTETTADELVKLFGNDIASLVLEVTKDTTLPKSIQYETAILNASNLSPRAKTLKLADLFSNISSLATDPPIDWSIAKRFAYLSYAMQMQPGLIGGNSKLLFDLDALNIRTICSLPFRDHIKDMPKKPLRQQENEAVDLLKAKIDRVVANPKQAEETLVRIVSNLLKTKGS